MPRIPSTYVTAIPIREPGSKSPKAATNTPPGVGRSSCPGLVASVYVAVLLGAGCGIAHEVDAGPVDAGLPDAGDDGGGGADAGVDVAAEVYAFCVRRFELLCAGRMACCDRPDSARSICLPEDFTQSHCRHLSMDPALADSSLLWDSAAAAAHLAELEAGMASCTERDRSWTYARVVTGTLAEGADCTPYRPQRGALGALACAPGLRCELTGTFDAYSGRCTAAGETGDSCVFDEECSDSLRCVAHRQDVAHWGCCEAPRGEGEECRPDYACSSVFCEARTCIEPEPGDTWCLTWA